MAGNRNYLDQLKQIECPDATYNPTEHPLVFDKAEGSLIWDVEGRQYIDFCSGFGVMAVGHNHPRLRSLHEDSKRLFHGMGDVYPSRDKVCFLTELISKLPIRIDSGALSVTGSQAVEFALKTAMTFTGKSGIVALKGGYHGLEFGSLAVTSRSDFREGFHSWLNEDRVCFINPEAGVDDIDGAFSHLEKKGCGVAAVIVEPIMGRLGTIPLSRSFLELLADCCHRMGALLIFDEVFCGYGRTGKMTFAEEVEADLICLGKPMGGGLPLSGVFGPRSVMTAWAESQGEAKHTGTFFGHPLSCAYGREVLQIFESESLLSKVLEKETLFRSVISEKLPDSVKVRGEGLMLAIDTGIDGGGARLMNECRARGLIGLAAGERGESFALSPAYNISQELLLEGLGILERVYK